MLNRPLIIGLAVVIAVCVLFDLTFLFPASYEYCQPNEYTHAKDCTPEYLGPFIFRWIVAVADAHNGLITAVATLFVAGFTWTLWRTSSKQAELTRDSIKLARDEFIATHRPKIILREAFCGPVLEGTEIRVIMNFANIGTTEGTIVNSVLDIEAVSTKQTRFFLSPTAEAANELGTLTLAGGASRLVSFNDLPNRRPNTAAPPTWNNELFGLKSGYRAARDGPIETVHFRDHVVHLVGQLVYEDGQGQRRRTAFRRVLDPARQRFYRLEADEPDLDYAD